MRRVAFLAPVCALAASLIMAGTALADATPVELVLVYLPNVSNTGSQAASGIAELVMQEGEVRLQATHLQHLDDDSQYVAWVINTHTNEFRRVGAFNASADTGAVHYENVLPDAIPNKGWDLLLVTLEDNPDATQPSKQHSIAATFPRPDGDPVPAMLPNTGGDPDASVVLPTSNRPDWLAMSGLAALTASIGFGAGLGLGLKKK